MQSVLVTGAAGFIGFHVARRLLADGSAVVGLDNINSYYDPDLKKARLAELAAYANFRFEQHDVADRDAIAKLFAAHRFETVIHLAAMNKVIGRDIWIGVWSLFWALVALRYWEGGGKGRGIDPGELWRRFPKFVIGFFIATAIVSLYFGDTITAGQTTDFLRPMGALRGIVFTLCFLAIGLTTRFSELELVNWRAAFAFASGAIVNVIAGYLLSAQVFYDYWSKF